MVVAAFQKGEARRPWVQSLPNNTSRSCSKNYCIYCYLCVSTFHTRCICEAENSLWELSLSVMGISRIKLRSLSLAASTISRWAILLSLVLKFKKGLWVWFSDKALAYYVRGLGSSPWLHKTSKIPTTTVTINIHGYILSRWYLDIYYSLKAETNYHAWTLAVCWALL